MSELSRVVGHQVGVRELVVLRGNPHTFGVRSLVSKNSSDHSKGEKHQTNRSWDILGDTWPILLRLSRP